MGLKLLTTNLQEGIQTYPNHNTPSTSGGFNYGGGTIFNSLVFNQRSLKFGKGTSYDRPGQGFSREPFIGKNIDLPGIDDQPSGFLGFIDSLSDGLVRGGAVTAATRSAKDVARISKFYLSKRGIGFLTTQIALQLSNPKIESGNSSIKILGKDLSLNRNRTFNLGLNLIAQAGINFTGIHFDRSGISPIWPEDQKYEKIVSDIPYANTAGDIKNRELDGEGNRLLTLFKGHIIGEQKESQDEKSKLGQFFANVGDSIKKITGESERNLLYEYNSGPGSLYGIGKTSIYKYTDTNKENNPIP